uniref:DNA polymerase family B n=1 Tax=Siphoviridae sp. ctxMM9 TaxID=2827973 RepID=A0A8S5T6J7_9CAUD|nr:MAG TPA: DNA polymerase family B [Siphoviridae sp. ctxMM9]
MSPIFYCISDVTLCPYLYHYDKLVCATSKGVPAVRLI